MKLNRIINRWVALGVSLLGIIALLILQFVWLRNAYEVSEQNFRDKCTLHLITAIEKELFIRANSTNLKVQIKDEDNAAIPPKDKLIHEGDVKTFDQIRRRIQDIMVFMGKECDLNDLDSIFNELVINNIGFIPAHQFYLVKDTTTDEYVVANNGQTNYNDISHAIEKDSKLIKNLKKPISIRLNSFQVVFIDITNPQANFIKTAKHYLLMSLFLALTIAYILVFLMRSTLRENRFVRFIKEYTNALTHDLRSPLNNVHMAARILHDGTLSLKQDEAKEYLRICKEQSKNMLDSIDRILTVAKAEHTELFIVPKKMPLLPFLQTQKEAFLKDMLHEKPLTISINCEPDTIEVAWDKELMENVVNNLLDNAVKYSYESVDVNIDAFIEQNEVHIRFKDNGMGIDPKDLEEIFKYFHQGSLLERKRMFGYGIGLSFMKKVIEAHQGRVLVESQLKQGTCFTLIFPVSNV